MSCFMEKLPNFFGKSLHIFWTLYTSDNDHSVKWYIFCTKQMLCFWWDFVKFPCRVSMIVTSPQLHNHGIEHNNANTSRFVATQNPILPRLLMKLSEIIRWFPADSENIWIYLNTSENILMIFWKQMKLSEIIWWFPALSEIATSKTWAECVFFAEKNDTAQRLARGFGGLAPPSAMTKINFCWCYSPTKLKLVMADIRIKIRKSEVGKLTNWNW